MPDPSEIYRVAADWDGDTGERLLTMLSSLAPDQHERFRAAAERAGGVLELVKPALFGPTRLLGCYSMVPAGHVLITVADATLATIGTVEVAEMDAAIEQYEHELNAFEEGREMRREGGLGTFAAVHALETSGSADPRGGVGLNKGVVGETLRDPDIRATVHRIAAIGKVPACAVLVDQPHQGSLALLLIHGPCWPQEALARA